MKVTFWKCSLTFWIIGILVALALFLDEKLLRGWSYPVFHLVEVLWPSSIFLLATDGSDSSVGSYLIVVIAIVVNGLAYLLVGALLWLLGRLALAMRVD